MKVQRSTFKVELSHVIMFPRLCNGQVESKAIARTVPLPSAREDVSIPIPEPDVAVETYRRD
jgi:hypothetical protein